MTFSVRLRLLAALVCCQILTALTIDRASAEEASDSSGSDRPISFSLDIRPILADKCYHCHGPDPTHREADLRLDDEASAKSGGGSAAAVVAGKPDESELIARIESSDDDIRMPPPSSRKSLSPEQIALLRKWVLAGAPWGPHWSLRPLERPTPPEATSSWVRGPIDAWALAGMARHGLSPAPPADPYTLCRRLSLDLVGLPPTVERADAFAEQFQRDSQRAVEQFADELLDSQDFGEHWARMWLDLARYADTKGYEKDRRRSMWPYRDWVVEAFNRDLPLEQFTLEQLAGDLLPDATEKQRIATAFHRGTPANDENGTDDEEFRVAAVKDRVDTTLQVWLGVTAGCAKCHTHKYDPITIEDYYRVFAVFNQTEDSDRPDDEPLLPLPTYRQQRRSLQLAADRKSVEGQLAAARAAAFATKEPLWSRAQPLTAVSEGGAELIVCDDASVEARGKCPDADVYQIEAEFPAGKLRSLRLETLLPDETTLRDGAKQASTVGRSPGDGNFVISELVLALVQGDAVTPLKLIDAHADFAQEHWPVEHAVDGDPATGWAVDGQRNQPHWAAFALAEPIDSSTPVKLRLTLAQKFGKCLVVDRVRWSMSSRSLKNVLPKDDAPTAKLARRAADMKRQWEELQDDIPRLPVMEELPTDRARVTHVHRRGSFLDPGEVVAPGFVESLAPASPALPANRLGFAEWLVDRRNPLTYRVAANRIWAQLFGRGIVETEEDFGSQGSLPTHPELLDSLACEYRDACGGRLKPLLRQIVASNTYQQAYAGDEERRTVDPRNAWLSRGARFRLTGEAIRDGALATSGLLSHKRGGPPVMPPQPDGLWRSAYNGSRWITSEGEDRYRRSIYTFWKRTSPYPSLEMFDATTRELCLMRRMRTNTPLQAMVLLNDPAFVEAAAHLAETTLDAPPTSDRERLRSMMRRVLARPIEDGEIERLERLLGAAQERYAEHLTDAEKLLSCCAFRRNPDRCVSVQAAWTVVASAVLNLDEAIVRP